MHTRCFRQLFHRRAQRKFKKLIYEFNSLPIAIRASWEASQIITDNDLRLYLTITSNETSHLITVKSTL
jgi:hypothetical protein